MRMSLVVRESLTDINSDYITTSTVALGALLAGNPLVLLPCSERGRKGGPITTIRTMLFE